MKIKFDLDLFWSLPRCTGSFYDETWGSYCAIGSALKAMGVSNQELHLGFGGETYRKLPFRDKLNEIWMLNDGFDGRESNPEKAKRMMLDYLQEIDAIEFIESPTVFTKEEVKVNV